MCVGNAQLNLAISLAAWHRSPLPPHVSGLSLALVHLSTNMLKSVWASNFWKPLIHINMSKILGNIDDYSNDKSDFDSEEEETNNILDKISKFWRDQ